MYSVTISIPQLPKTPNSIGKTSFWYSHNERNRWQKLVGFALMGKVPSMPLNKARVQATRCSSREIDTDNLYGSFKSVIDSLKFHGVVIDDKPSCVFLNCQWEKVKNKDAGIRLTVEEIENV